MKSEHELARWLHQDGLGRYAAAAERDFFHAQWPLCQGKLSVALTLSAVKEWWPAEACRVAPRENDGHIVAALPQLPFADHSIYTLFLPHGLDLYREHDILLAECFRVLQPYGQLLLSGFNPYSLWRFGRAKPLFREALSLSQTKRLLQSAGFSLSTGRFMLYVPPVEHHHHWRFMEHAGNRWWPHAAAIYGLTATKLIAPLTPASRENMQTIEGINWPSVGCTAKSR